MLRGCLALIGGFVIMTGMGGVYAWSAFVPVLRADHLFTTAQTQIVFGTIIAVFTLAMVWAGRLLKRWGPRLLSLAGGLLFACGYWVASQSGGGFAGVLAGIGLLSGAGIGFGYVSAIASAVQWFPHRKGLAVGVVVAGFGGGAIVLSQWVERLLGAGLSVPDIFRVIAVNYGAVICLASLILFRPPAGPASEAAETPGVAALCRDRFFRKLVAGMFCGTFAGLLVIGNLKPIGVDGNLSAATAGLAISFLAAGNLAGRIVWGWVSDKLGYRAIPLSLLMLAGALLALVPGHHNGIAFAAAAMLVGFGFGSCFVLYAAQVATRYGPRLVPNVYPLVFLAYGLSGIIGPTVGGVLFDLTSSYEPAILTSVGVVLSGVGLVWPWRQNMAEAALCAAKAFAGRSQEYPR